MSEYIVKYPLDLTGVSPENRIEGEPHTLVPGINRSAVPLYGAFYTESLVVRDADTTEILTPNDQYIPIMYHEEASERSGKEVCGGVIVTDGTVSQNIILDYQLVGGDFQNITQIILDLIENLNLDEREVMWGDLLGRPNAYPPSHHLHDIGDLFGFEYLVESVNGLKEAVLYGDIASHDELKAIIEARRQELHSRIDAFRAAYDEFIARRDNPHQVTKAQTGLGSVANHPLASQSEAESGSLNTRYMTPLRTYQAIDVFAIEPFIEHKEDYTNPHRVTKAQVGLGQVEDYPLSTRSEAENGVLDTSYMTPVRVKQAVDIQAVAPLTTHLNRVDNPHQVTKAQTGLGLVANYPPADQNEAETGTVNNRVMTPLRVLQAITEQVGIPFQAHVNNASNPHQVTKAQVGLSNVPNWPGATSAQARAADITSAFMSPKRTHEFLIEHLRLADNTTRMNEVGAVGWYGNVRTSGGFYGGTTSPISTNRVNLDAALHVTQIHGNGRNLTGMVKSQVGLSNVDNFATAGEAAAKAGNNNSLFMTPLRVAQAIAEKAGTQLQNHVDNTSNPHNVTKVQVGLGNVTNDRQVARSGDTMTGNLNFNATEKGITWGMNSDGASILFYNTEDGDNDSRLEFQTNDNGDEYFRWTHKQSTGTSEYMRLQSSGLTVNKRVTAQAFYGNGRNLTGMVKSQVGLDRVQNWSPSTQAEAVGGTDNNSYMTPLRVAQAITQQAGDAVVSHTGDKNNPHNVTKAQVGLGSVENHSIASKAEAEAGNVNYRYMTPLRVAQAITQQAGAAVSGHINNTSNPHNVTKAQLGLGSVDNTASSISPTPNTLVKRDSTGDVHARLFRSEYSSPNGSIGFIMTQVNTSSNNYVRPSTPTQVKAALNLSKGDVGLAGVQDLPLATETEAKAGTAHNRYMTPLRVAQAITQQAGAAVSGHINNTSNPHNVTKAQVGLDKVDNYSRADYDSRYVSAQSDDVKMGGLDIFANGSTGGVFSNQNFGLRVRSSEGGIVTRAYGNNSQDSYAALNSSGEKVFNVRAADGMALSKTDFVITSDRRVKENLERISDPISKIKQISGYTYDRIDMKTKRQAGVVAQEIMKVLPEVVDEDDSGRLSVSYGQLQALVIEAVKALDTRLDLLITTLSDNDIVNINW